MQPLWATAYGNGILPLMEMVYYRLWKWYVTAYGNGMLPLMVMIGNHFNQPK